MEVTELFSLVSAMHGAVFTAVAARLDQRSDEKLEQLGANLDEWSMPPVGYVREMPGRHGGLVAARIIVR
jgi:hypothetical protein